MKQKEIKKPSGTVEKQKAPATGVTGFAFGKQNYKLLLIGLALILVGFLLMIGGGSDDPNVFSDKIFNFRRLTLAPILVLAGYVVEIFAIMKKPKD
jgi:predicted cobalt transporter CbtA